MTERAPDPMGAVMDPVTATLIAAAASLLVWTGTAFARTTSQRTSDRHVRIGAHLGLRPTAYGLVGRRGKVYVRVNEVPPPIGSAAGWEVEIEATIPADLGFDWQILVFG